MNPILFPSTETEFDTNGIGVLSDAISCYGDEERNGLFELELIYPIDGKWYDQIADRGIILAKPNLQQEPQPFRIYSITRPANGRVTIKAAHWSYDLSGVPVTPFVAYNAAAAVQQINSQMVVATPFVVETNKAVVATMTSSVPRSVRQLLGGMEGSLLDVYGGEYRWGRYKVELLQARGADNGVSIRYGKNLVDLTQESNVAACYTGVYPYYANEDGTLVTLPEQTINAPGTYDYNKILTLDLSDQFTEGAPTVEQLRSAANSYMITYGIGVPDVNLRVSYAQAPDQLDAVNLCDTVHIYFERLGVDATAKVIKTRFDVLRERYVSIELGSARASIAQTIVNANTQITENRRDLILQAREIRKEFEETIDALRSSLSDNLGDASQITQKVDMIEAAVSSLQSAVSAVITDNSVTINFLQTLSDIVNQNADSTNEKLETIERYIRFVNGSIVMGILGNQIKLKIMNDTIFFFSGDDDTTNLDNAFAYFTNDQFYVPSIITNSVQFGRSTTYRNFIWKVRENGHISLLRY